jgi:predicted signal transduction protein with EAL and GGDEF domain
MGILYLMLVTGIGILLYAFFVNSELYRRQILFLLAISLIPLGLNVPYIVADVSLYRLRDVTLEYQQQSELKRIAYLDELTGVCNRRQLEITAINVLSPDSQKNWPVALIYLDLNAFKPINDAYGHEAGDIVLRHVARCLQSSGYTLQIKRNVSIQTSQPSRDSDVSIRSGCCKITLEVF